MDELVCDFCDGLLWINSKSPTMVCRHCGQTVHVPAHAIARAPEQPIPLDYSAPVAPPILPKPHKLFGLSFSGNLTSDTGVKGRGKGIKGGPGKEGKAILITGDATLCYPSANHITAEQGCIEFWVRNGWQGDDGGDYVFFDIGDGFHNRIRIFKDAANNFRFVILGPSSEMGVFYNVSHWQAGEWHHIRANWHGDEMELYLDNEKNSWGKRVKVTMPAQLAEYFFIGSNFDGSQQAQSVIDEFAIYSGPLT